MAGKGLGIFDQGENEMKVLIKTQRVSTRKELDKGKMKICRILTFEDNGNPDQIDLEVEKRIYIVPRKEILRAFRLFAENS